MSESASTNRRHRRQLGFAFFVGGFFSFLIIILALAILHKIGSSTPATIAHAVFEKPGNELIDVSEELDRPDRPGVTTDFFEQELSAGRSKSVLALTPQILDELIELKAGIENAGNPTNVQRHDTLITKRHKQMGYVQRANARADIYMLRTKFGNIDPPLLFIHPQSPMSTRLKDYLQKNALLRVSYSTDELGLRNTIPKVNSANRVYVLGDSVAFGVLVNDSDTVASRLQQELGSSAKVYNLGVGGYGPEQILMRAERGIVSGEKTVIVYVACENDFWMLKDGRRERRLERRRVESTLSRLALLQNRTSATVIVVLHTYMEYVNRHIVLVWDDMWLRSTHQLREDMRVLTKQAGLPFIDWANLAEDFKSKKGTTFAPFALYMDHCHFSPEGNQILAEAISRKLQSMIKL